MNYTIDTIRNIREQVRAELKTSRYEHTLGVAYTAACLAFLHGVDPLQAELAGVLHDCAKCYSNEELIRLCDEAGIRLSPEEIVSPQVIHAIYGRYLAASRYGVSDEDVLCAIEYHTTGRAGMSTLEKIVYIADYIEPLRKEAPNLPEMRRLAFQDLDECMYQILMATVEYLSSSGRAVVPATMEAFEWFRREREHR